MPFLTEPTVALVVDRVRYRRAEFVVAFESLERRERVHPLAGLEEVPGRLELRFRRRGGFGLGLLGRDRAGHQEKEQCALHWAAATLSGRGRNATFFRLA